MNDAPYQEMYAVRGSGGDSGSNGAEPWRTQPIDHDALLLTSWFIYIYIYLVLSTPNLSGDARPGSCVASGGAHLAALYGLVQASSTKIIIWRHLMRYVHISRSLHP